MLRAFLKKIQRKKVWMLHALSLENYNYSLSRDNFVLFLNYVENELKNGHGLLTFDDGFDSVYNYAFPILKQKNIPFVCFLVVDFIDTAGYLSSSQIKEMIQSGLMTIQSHGMTHEVLSNLTESQIKSEICFSKETLELKFECSIDSFAYSHGITSKSAIKSLKKSGYKTAYIATNGLASMFFKNKYAMPRIAIHDRNFNEIIELYYGKK